VIQRCSSTTGRVGFRRFYAFVLTRRDSPFAGERGLSTAQRSAIWEGNWTGTVVGARANDGSCWRKQAPTAQVRCCRTGDVTQLIFSLREPSQMPHEAHVQKKMPHEASGTDTPFPVCGLLFVLAARSAGIAGGPSDTARQATGRGWSVGLVRSGHGVKRIRRRTPATDFGFHSQHAHSERHHHQPRAMMRCRLPPLSVLGKASFLYSWRWEDERAHYGRPPA